MEPVLQVCPPVSTLYTRYLLKSIEYILEICSILHSRGYTINLALPAGQGDYALRYPFISSTYALGGTLLSPVAGRTLAIPAAAVESPVLEQTEETVAQRSRDCTLADTTSGFSQLLRSANSDLIFVDWKIQSAVGSVNELRTPLAVMWSQEAWSMRQPQTAASATKLLEFRDYIYERLESLVVLRILKDFFMSFERMPANIETQPCDEANCLSFINTIFDLVLPGDFSGAITIGPVISSSYAIISAELQTFLDAHRRVLYINLGARAKLSSIDLQQIIEGVISALDKGYIDGVIWATRSLRREQFFDVFEPLLDGEDPNWIFLPFTPQRAIFGHPSTRILLSQCGLSSLNEAIYHGIPILTINKEHPLNTEYSVRAGITLTIPYDNIRAMDICLEIGYIVRDIYGAFQRAVRSMQNIAVANSRRKELAANAIESAIRENSLVARESIST